MNFQVLITNGSRIRLWWRAHHYLTFIQSGLLFSWAETEDNDDFRRLFVVFSLYIGMIQVAQFYYQSRSLYYKRAFPAVSLYSRLLGWRLPARCCLWRGRGGMF